jgi:hypothetical protein
VVIGTKLEGGIGLVRYSASVNNRENGLLLVHGLELEVAEWNRHGKGIILDGIH